MFLVGLTGGIATGKSTVARFIAEVGVTVIDADVAARDAVAPGSRAWRRIQAEFGNEFLDPHGNIDRAKLGQLVFRSPEDRRRLNAIVHPEVSRILAWRVFLAFLALPQFVVVDLPLLFETRAAWMFHRVVVVRCDSDTQRQRLVSRDRMPVEDAEARIASQMPLEDKVAAADRVVHNEGDVEQTRRQTVDLMEEIRRDRFHWVVRALVFSTMFGSLGLILFLLF